MAKHGGFRKATTMGLFLSCAVVGVLSAETRARIVLLRPNGPDVPFAKDDPGGLNWVSRDATYEVSSTHTGHSPLPSLLTGQGPLYSVGSTKDCYAFHTSEEKAPHIIIALAGAPMIQRLFIENRRDGQFERARGLTVWVSGDKKSWQPVWTAKGFARSWMVTLKAPIDAAYVKIGLTGTNYLHLRRVKIYGRSGGIPSVTRVQRQDRIELNDGDVLLGTIENKSYTVTTFYGTIEVPARRVVGVVPDRDKPRRVSLVQTDGQVIVGTLAEKTVELTLSVGPTLNVPPASIRQLSYRISEDRPAGLAASEPVVLLRSGDRLIWTECRTKLQLTGPWGAVDLPLRSLQSIEWTDTEGSSHRARFPGGTVLAGTLGAEKLTLKLKVVPELEIASKDVRLIALPTKALPPFEPAATMLLHNGSRLLGRLEDETLALRTEFGQVDVYVGDLKTLTHDAERAGHVTIATWDGTTLRGQLAAPRLTCRIAPNGPSVSLLTTRIASITQPFPLLRPAAQAKAEKLIAQLASESYKDREAATTELVKMGKGVVPLLRKHANSPDPEVRQRIEDILKQTDPKKVGAVPPPDVDMLNRRIILHTRVSQQRIGDAHLVVKDCIAAENTSIPVSNTAGDKGSAKPAATAAQTGTATEREGEIARLTGPAILAKLRAFDAKYESGLTVTAYSPGEKHNYRPMGSRGAGVPDRFLPAIGKHWTLTMAEGRRVLIVKSAEVPISTFRPVALTVPEAKAGRGFPGVEVADRTFWGQDYVGKVSVYRTYTREGRQIKVLAENTSVYFCLPDDRSWDRPLMQLMWSMGRGYSKYIHELDSAVRLPNGSVKCSGPGTDNPSDTDPARWELIVDPAADYMVRSAKFAEEGDPSAFYEVTTSGTKIMDKRIVPKTAVWRSGDTRLMFSFRDVGQEPDSALLKTTEQAMLGPYTGSARVYDWRMKPLRSSLLKAGQKYETFAIIRQSLVGRKLGSLERFGLSLDEKRTAGKRILVCFWSVQQRPSRHMMLQLAERRRELESKKIVVVAVQASEAEGEGSRQMVARQQE